MSFNLGGLLEGVEFVGQIQHEALVVVDHTKEALMAGLGSGHMEVVHCLDPGLK